MIGIDILELEEFRKQLKNGGAAFVRRAYLECELEDRDETHLAGIFCAKEAVLKALGVEAGAWQRIAVKFDPSGKPFAEFDGRVIPISIANHGDYVVAVAVLPNYDRDRVQR